MKKIALLLKSPSMWKTLIEEYFSEVCVMRHEHFIHDDDLVFVETSECPISVLQKIHTAKNLRPELRVFGLGATSPENVALFDCIFERPTDLLDFTKKISEKLPLKERVRLSVTDDDPDILSMVCDYFEGRSSPSFEILRATHGKEALNLIQKSRPDAMILDVKMPFMTGSELYCKLQKQNEKIPTIIFFDAISASDLDMIKKAGQPVIVEKGCRESSLAYLMASVKKLVYFSGC